MSEPPGAAVTPVAAVRAFVEDRALAGGALCAACRCGAVPSPCVSLCTLDEAKEVCRGCGRTVAEIAGWSGMSTAERCAVRLRLRPSTR
ncbi:MAG: DUF1289 domain-containing protein [Planctomycetota bacterium]